MIEEQERTQLAEQEKIKLQEIREEKLRQKIRDESDEIRKLESRLKLVQANKERAAQIEYNKL